MTCIADGCVLEVVDETTGEIQCRPVDDVGIGDVVRDPLTFRYSMVACVVDQTTAGLWPLYTYLGLTADAAQWVHHPSRGWVRISELGTRSTQRCSRLFSLVLRGGKAVRVSGVTCCTNDAYDVVSSVSLSSSLVSPRVASAGTWRRL